MTNSTHTRQTFTSFAPSCASAQTPPMLSERPNLAADMGEATALPFPRLLPGVRVGDALATAAPIVDTFLGLFEGVRLGAVVLRFP